MSQLSACGTITGWETGHMEDRKETREWLVNRAYTLFKLPKHPESGTLT